MEQGHVELISPGGIVLAAQDAKQIGQRRDDAVTAQVLAAVARDQRFEAFTPDAAGNVKAYVPLRIGGSGVSRRPSATSADNRTASASGRIAWRRSST